jgi:hypothetical protein
MPLSQRLPGNGSRSFRTHCRIWSIAPLYKHPHGCKAWTRTFLDTFLKASSITIFRRASRADVTNAIACVDIDSIGIAAGRRIASTIRPSAVRPRSPARVPCHALPGNPALAVPCACSRFQQQRQRQQRLCLWPQLRAQA